MSKSRSATTPSEIRPKLRFPEFRDAEGWEEEELRTLADPVSDRAENGDDNNILTLSGEQGLVLQSEYFGKQVAGTNAERYLRIQRDDFVYNDRTTKASAYGTIKRLKNHPHGIVSPIYKCFRFKEGELPSFWEWYFEAGAHEAQLRNLANEGARAGRFNVSIDRFLSTSVWASRSISREQQKIAACLNSLDELIGVEERKLDALKAHKKGLMQQLFPRDGATVPRLRFPEFREAGEWGVSSLRSACQMQAGKFVSASEISGTPEPGLFPCYGGNGLRGYTKTYTHSGRYPLIGRQGALCGNVKLATGDFHATEHAVVVTPRDGVDVDWLFYALELADLNQYATGQAQPGLSVERLESVSFAQPPFEREQHRIASSLSSLDELIAAQAAKLEALATHKKGLMQQLFPSAAEDET